MENNEGPKVRTTHTAVTSDTVVHAYVVSTDALRCRSTPTFTRTGRNAQGTVTCPTCFSDLTRPRTR